MESVGIRELKEHTSEIIRRVGENQETIEITRRGKVVARLAPVKRPMSREEMRQESLEAWARMDKLAEEIGAAWPEGMSAVEAIREQRREL